MGHAIHFLERVERLSLAHAELALGLYRDRRLVEAVLAMADLPEGAERVAVALAEGPTPPYIVVTRDGHFVTCLGEGMSPGELPVLSYPRLEKLAASLATLRQRLLEAKRTGNGPTEFGDLLARIFETGAAMGRERWLELEAFRPLVEPYLVDLLGTAVRTSWRERYVLDPVLTKANPERLNAPQREALRHWWGRTWAIGHLSTLLAPRAREVVEKLAGPDRPLGYQFALAGQMSALTPLFIRSCYLVGCAGKPLLPEMKHALARPMYPTLYMPVFLSLVAMALRHTGLSAEILKCLNRIPPAPLILDEERVTAEHLLPLVNKLLTDGPDIVLGLALPRGREIYQELTRDLPAGSPWRIARDEDLPEDLAGAALCNVVESVFSGRAILDTLFALCWVARRPAVDMHLPDAFLEAAGGALSAERCAIPFARSITRAGKVFVRDERPAPNAPCACGSGKKYKRCCALKQAG